LAGRPLAVEEHVGAVVEDGHHGLGRAGIGEIQTPGPEGELRALIAALLASVR